jgi:hypothetical protein
MPVSMLEDLIGQSDSVLAAIDPLEINLLVARGIPACRDLPIESYQRTADGWAVDLASRLAVFEDQFHESPDAWKNDIRFFRLGVLCWYLAEILGIRYREDQRELQAISYTDPSDLFVHGVMDTRQGTCGNLAALHVAIAWRLGWPLHLACAGPHIFCRYDDGEVVHNLEATNNSQRGFQSHPDEHYQESRGVPDVAIKCGSDLRAISPRQMLGLFIGLRGRHREDLGLLAEAETDYLLARTLFPENRRLYMAQIGVSVQLSDRRFNVGEAGHHTGLARWLRGESDQAIKVEPGFAINVEG